MTQFQTAVKELIQNHIITQVGHGRTAESLNPEEAIELGRRLDALDQSSRNSINPLFAMISDLRSFIVANLDMYQEEKDRQKLDSQMFLAMSVLIAMLEEETSAVWFYIDKDVERHLLAVNKHLKHETLDQTINQLLGEALKSWHGTINLKAAPTTRPAALGPKPKIAK